MNVSRETAPSTYVAFVLGIVVVLFWPHANLVTTVSEHRLDRLNDIAGIVFPAVALFGATVAALPAGRPTLSHRPAWNRTDRERSIPDLGRATLDGLAIGSASLVPFSAIAAILSVPWTTLFGIAILFIGTAVFGRVVGEAIRAIKASIFFRRTLAFAIVVGWLVASTVYLPALNPISTTRALLSLRVDVGPAILPLSAAYVGVGGGVGVLIAFLHHRKREGVSSDR